MKKTIITLGLLILCLQHNAIGQTDIARAQAMFMYNFTRLVEFSNSNKSGDYIIGFIGMSDTYVEMKNFSIGKMVGNQQIFVVKYNTVEEISKCHILFVPFNKTKEIENIITQLRGSSTLIISEKNGAIKNGSAINFIVNDDKLKFEIKPDNATKFQIILSQKIKEMALNVF
jgi:hypothetical protein